MVLGLLTGSDPLEAAIQAGETPSPELVAAAGEREGLRPRAAWGLLAFVVAGLVGAPFVAGFLQMLPRLPAPKPPAALEDRAREFVRTMGVATAPVDDAWGLGLDWGYLGWVREKDPAPGRWERALAGGTPPVLQFWYRQSPRPIVSLLPGRARLRGEARDGRHGHGLGHLRRERPAAALRRDPAPARGRERESGRGAGLVAPVRRGSARPGAPQGGRAEVDAALPQRRARGVGGRVAGAQGRDRSGSRRRRTAGGRCGSR